MNNMKKDRWWRRGPIRKIIIAIFCAFVLLGIGILFTGYWNRTIMLTDDIIQDYSKAICIPAIWYPGIEPKVKGWDYTLELNGGKVRLQGYDAVGGMVKGLYSEERRPRTIANKGDYVYPADIRLDKKSMVLYMKMRGLAGGIEEQTWLITYDLSKKDSLKEAEVSGRVLPAECGDPVEN